METILAQSSGVQLLFGEVAMNLKEKSQAIIAAICGSQAYHCLGREIYMCL